MPDFDFEISFKSVQQVTLPPRAPQPAPGTCNVVITFQVLGPKTGIDEVQVYAVNAVDTIPAGLGDVVDTVDLTIPDYAYSSVVVLQAGAAFTLYLCPRSKDNNGQLEDDTEGAYWESVCVAFPFTTHTTQAPPPGALTPPMIVSADAIPKTLYRPNGIQVSWDSTVSYDAWNVEWIVVGASGTFRTQSAELDFTGMSGTFTCAPTTVGVTYLIAVEGGQNQLFGGHNWSAWSAFVQVTASNTHSLLVFLQASGVSGRGGIKQFLPAPPVSMRSIMGI